MNHVKPWKWKPDPFFAPINLWTKFKSIIITRGSWALHLYILTLELPRIIWKIWSNNEQLMVRTSNRSEIAETGFLGIPKLSRPRNGLSANSTREFFIFFQIFAIIYETHYARRKILIFRENDPSLNSTSLIFINQKNCH